MSNMDIWQKMKQPPASALKAIGAGRLKGKSDINPQWRYQIMTEAFGACGIGWKYTIDKLWNEPASDGQIFAFAQVSVYIKDNDKWGESIEGIGGSMLLQQEAKGMHTNDEGYKMAVTDALGTAMKMLGVAADIYAGKWDGSKYNDEPKPENNTPRPEPKKQSEPKSAGDQKLDTELFRDCDNPIPDDKMPKIFALWDYWMKKKMDGKSRAFPANFANTVFAFKGYYPDKNWSQAEGLKLVEYLEQNESKFTE